jgi:type I restriction enzyme S subunit
LPGSQIRADKVFRVERGDFVYNRLFAWKGSFAVATEANAGCYVSNEFPCFEINQDRADAQFLWRHFSRVSAWEKALGLSTGGTPTSRNRLKEDKFLAIEIPLPPLSEQRRIVARIEELATKINEAHALRQGAAVEAEALITAQLRAAYSFQAKRHGSTRLGQLITEAGYGSSEKCSLDRDEDAVPVLRIPNVASERIHLDDLKFALLSMRDRQRLHLANGDILIVRTNGSLDLVGRSAVVDDLPEPMAFASYMIRLRLDSSTILPAYAQRMLRHLRISGQLIDFARTTAGQFNVSLGRLRTAEIPLPPLAQQHHIVADLDALQAQVDTLKTLQAQTAAELDALLPSILDNAFTGRL